MCICIYVCLFSYVINIYLHPGRASFLLAFPFLLGDGWAGVVQDGEDAGAVSLYVVDVCVRMCVSKF